MNQKEIRRYLAVIKRAASLIEGMLDDDGGLLEEMSRDIERIDPQPIEDVRQSHLKKLLDIQEWPEAVPEHLMAGPTDDDQERRARAVLDMMVDRNLENARFLDFGCGEGWIANEALKRGCSNSTGYDITWNDKWEQFKDGPVFTTVYNELPKSYYDVVFLYDVLDHCFEPENVMDQILQCIKPDGVLYVRCHPWTARHATHLWKQGINKSYLHLFMTWEEMRKLLGESPLFTRPEKNPMEAYYWWFKNFQIVKERPIEEPVPDFFRSAPFKELLAKEQEIEPSKINKFLDFMRLQFVDFVLVPRKHES